MFGWKCLRINILCMINRVNREIREIRETRKLSEEGSGFFACFA